MRSISILQIALEAARIVLQTALPQVSFVRLQEREILAVLCLNDCVATAVVEYQIQALVAL
ncbi:hypothetical protein [Blastopirellula retiformator]|uniref:hypothetical protein n=1 Tax=Blastopirellula retiformator TaxID=2527970 RepID=UPI001645619C|nr:hypothetical protein [Blastopirellula retiformator]